MVLFVWLSFVFGFVYRVFGVFVSHSATRPACNSLNSTCQPWNSWQSPCLSVLSSGIMLGAIMPVFAFDKSLTLLFKRGIERLW